DAGLAIEIEIASALRKHPASCYLQQLLEFKHGAIPLDGWLRVGVVIVVFPKVTGLSPKHQRPAIHFHFLGAPRNLVLQALKPLVGVREPFLCVQKLTVPELDRGHASILISSRRVFSGRSGVAEMACDCVVDASTPAAAGAFPAVLPSG